MTQKREGFEPSVEVTIQRCPGATLNPKTDKPFCDKTVRKVFLEDCYDCDPDHPRKLQSPLQKTFLPDDVKDQRYNMCRYILENADNGDSVQWWARNVVWIDPCASILAGIASIPFSEQEMYHCRKANQKGADRELREQRTPGTHTQTL